MFFFHHPQTIGFRLVMREISVSVDFYFIAFYSSLP